MVHTALRTVEPSTRPLTEAMPVLQARERIQEKTSEANPLAREGSPIAHQTQQVVTQVSASLTSDRQEVSFDTRSISASQSDAIQSIATSERMATTAPQAVMAGHAPAVETSPPTLTSAPTPLPRREKGVAVPASTIIPTSSAERPLPSEPGPISPSLTDSPLHPAPPNQLQAKPSPIEQARVALHQPASERPSTVDRPLPSTLAIQADYGWLAHELWTRVERLKGFPRLARLNGWQGKVVIRAVIDDQGRLVHQIIEESSGYEALDHHALELMKQVCPVALRHPLGQPQVAVHVPIHYRIEP